jgi:hypothetical protein
MLPVNGGWPTTLPVTRIAAASKPCRQRDAAAFGFRCAPG